jgi:hypothetical protein
MQLQQKLKQLKESFLAGGQATPEMLGIMEKSTEELQASGIMQRILKAGEVAPQFELPNQDGQPIASAKRLAQGPLVASFFRGVW